MRMYAAASTEVGYALRYTPGTISWKLSGGDLLQAPLRAASIWAGVTGCSGALADLVAFAEEDRLPSVEPMVERPTSARSCLNAPLVTGMAEQWAKVPTLWPAAAPPRPLLLLCFTGLVFAACCWTAAFPEDWLMLNFFKAFIKFVLHCEKKRWEKR